MKTRTKKYETPAITIVSLRMEQGFQVSQSIIGQANFFDATATGNGNDVVAGSVSHDENAFDGSWF